MKNEKGITLMALVIAMVVMLILASVIFNVAINGEIYSKVSDADKQMKQAEYIETISLAMTFSEKFTDIKNECKKLNLLQNAQYLEFEDDEILMITTPDNYGFLIQEKKIKGFDVININKGSIEIYPEYYMQKGKKIINKDKMFFITGTSTTNTVTITGDKNNTYDILMYNLSIDVNTLTDVCAFNISEGANVNLELLGENTLKSGKFCAGLQKSSTNGTLTIDGSGSLLCYGGESGAGIGGGRSDTTCSCTNIIINGGIISAYSGNDGSGIGSGSYGGAYVDNIIINGGELYARRY